MLSYIGRRLLIAIPTLILVSIFGLFSWPIGTLFSIYSLWVLFNSETTMLFKAQERMA